MFQAGEVTPSWALLLQLLTEGDLGPFGDVALFGDRRPEESPVLDAESIGRVYADEALLLFDMPRGRLPVVGVGERVPE